MAPKAKITTLKLLSARERNGVIVQMRMQAIVVDLEDTDYKMLSTALTTAGVPEAGSFLDDKFQSLILVERNPAINENDSGSATVELVYETVLPSDNQDLDAGDSHGIVYGKMSASIHQKTTNLLYPDGDRTKPRETIQVGHTYPIDDPRFKGIYKEQGGVITIHQPQKNFKFGGWKNTSSPWLVASALIGKVNSDIWMGEGARQWMIISVTWELMGTQTLDDSPRYKMTFEVQHNPDTWDSDVVFIDERNHKPPIGLKQEGINQAVAGKEFGIRTIKYQKSISYSDTFAVFFEQ